MSKWLHLISYIFLKNIVKNLKFKNKYVQKIWTKDETSETTVPYIHDSLQP